MKVKRVVRYKVTDFSILESSRQIHENCQFRLDKDRIELSGPKHGHIATGRVLDIRTTYNSAPDHLLIDVIVQKSGTVDKAIQFHLERWLVTFNGIE